MLEGINPTETLEEVQSIEGKVSNSDGDLIRELFPEAAEISYEPNEDRIYPVMPLSSEYSTLLPIVDKDLDSASSPEDLLAHLKKVDGLFQGRWDGKKVLGEDIFYSDSPVESGDYCHLMNEAFLPTLIKMESIISNSSAEKRLEVVGKLEKYVVDNYNYNDWYFTRASEIAKSMLYVGGVESFSAIKNISTYITDVRNDPNAIFWSEESGEVYESDTDYYEPIYLEWDTPDHLGFHSSVVGAVSKYYWSAEDKLEATKFLTEYLSINSEGSLHTYVKAFENLGVENSVPYLLKNLKSEDVLTRRMSAEILYRLELGKVGISEDGVEYLGKLYDLDKYNDPDFFVRRLNNSGLMAVLSEDGIEGVWDLNLESQEQLIHTEIRQLVSQDLFLPKADETEGERKLREEYLKLFVNNYESIFEDGFFKDTGVRLNSLELYEQGWFVLFYLENREDDDKVTQIKEFARKYGEYGLKAFLALDYCKDSNLILEFAQCEGIEDSVKTEIFKKFYLMESMSHKFRDLFTDTLGNDGLEFGTQLHEAFIRSSSDFLQAAGKIGREDETEVTIPEVLRGMGDIAKAAQTFGSIISNSSSIELFQNPQYQKEYGKDGNLIERSTTALIFYDRVLNVRTTVFMRPEPTVRVGNNYGGEARLNIHTAHLDENGKKIRESRIGIDLSDYGELVGEVGKEPVVSLDFCLDPIDPEKTDSGDELTRLLKSVPSYQGHHNERSFSPEMAEKFSIIVSGMRQYLENMYLAGR